MAGREDVSNRYLASGFGSSGVDSTISRMLGRDVPEKPQYCHQCGEATAPAYSPANNPSVIYCKTHYEQLYPATRCDGCNQPISGQYVNAQGKKFHTQCAPEGGRCVRCNKPVFGEAVQIQHKVYHIKCLTCTSCEKPLGTAYAEVGASPFCYNCANTVASATSAIPGVTYESAEDKERREAAKMQNELYANVQGGKEGCAFCRKVIASDAISFSGKLFHGDCFFCSSCGQNIGFSPFSEKSGSAFCHKCLAPAPSAAGNCAGCRQPLSGNVVTALNVKYHSNCFACSECGAALKGSYGAKAGKPVCTNCVAPKVTMAPAPSGDRKGGFVVDPRSGRKIYK